jgi:hypothetical protein
MSELELCYRQIKLQEEYKTKWLELNEPVVLEFFDLEIQRLKLSIMFKKCQGDVEKRVDLGYKILSKLRENCIQKQENLETLVEKGILDDGLYLLECNTNKKINDDLDGIYQECERLKKLYNISNK